MGYVNCYPSFNEQIDLITILNAMRNAGIKSIVFDTDDGDGGIKEPKDWTSGKVTETYDSVTTFSINRKF
jgi:hypothetical protein